jgi:hypothetical protein
MSKYYDDYDDEPIGGSNPYYCCSDCGRSDPEINGRLFKHLKFCKYRRQKIQERYIEMLKSYIKTLKSR